MMIYYCSPCERSFKDQQALDQHLRDSFTHKKFVTKSAPTQVSTIPSRRIQHTRRPEPLRQQDEIASSSTTSLVTGYSGVRNSSHKKIAWSIIDASEQPAELELLSRHCHPPEDLLKNKYLLHPYTTMDIANLRRCRNCNGKWKESILCPCFIF